MKRPEFIKHWTELEASEARHYPGDTELMAFGAPLARKLGISKELYPVQNTRDKISKKSMIHNGATPKIEVDPETYEVRADGELLTCAPAEVLPMAQRYFMF